MTTYNTGNPIGSKDPRDLYDNAENLDTAVNDTGRDTWTDRLGRSRKTMSGMEREFDVAQALREHRFNTFLESSGYRFLGDYAAGIEITEYNQLIRDSNGEFWRLSGQVELPYTTTGDWGEEEALFVAVGDAVLRQQLSGTPSAGLGALLVGGAPVTFSSVDELKEVDELYLSGRASYLVDGEWDYNTYTYSAGMSTNNADNLLIVPHISGNGCFVMTSGTIFTDGIIRVPSQIPSIEEAVTIASKINTHRHNRVRIILDSGFVFDAPVRIDSKACPHVILESEDPVVYVDPSINMGTASGLIHIVNSHGPTIALLIDMGGVETPAGIRYTNSVGQVAKSHGLINSGGRGLEVASASIVFAEDTIWDGAGGRGVRVSNSSVCQIRKSKIRNCGQEGLAISSALVNAEDVEITGNGLATTDPAGIDNAEASNISVVSSTLLFAKGICKSARGTGIRVYGSSNVNLEDAILEDNGGHGVFCLGASNISARRVTITGSGKSNVYIQGAGSFDAPNSILTGAGEHSLRIDQGGRANVRVGDLSGSVGNAIDIFRAEVAAEHAELGGCERAINMVGGSVSCYSARGSNSRDTGVHVTGGTAFLSNGRFEGSGKGIGLNNNSCAVIATNAKFRSGEVDTEEDVRVFNGGTVCFSGNTTGGTNIPPNTLTSNGIIFKD